jgi:MFS superfamily sulfate permease-like transporter
MSAFCLTGVVTILAKSALAGLLFLAGWSLLIFSFLSIIEYYRVKILKDLFDKTP